MHGPGPITATNPLGWEPGWAFPLTVLDDVAALLPRKRWWRWARDKALADWAQAGISFTVVEGPGAKYYPTLFPWDGGNAYQYMKDQTIRLMLDNAPARAGFGFYSKFAAMLDGAVAVYSPATTSGDWLRRYQRNILKGHIGHEIGHCLGLYHREGAIMGGGLKPDDHDLSSLRTFYSGG